MPQLTDPPAAETTYITHDGRPARLIGNVMMAEAVLTKNTYAGRITARQRGDGTAS